MVAGADNADAGSQLTTHPQLARPGQQKTPGALANLDVFYHLARGDVDDVYQTGDFGRDIYQLAVETDLDAFGLAADLDFERLLFRNKVVGREQRVFFIRCVQHAPVGAQVKGLGIFTHIDLLDNFFAGDVHDHDAVVIATSHHQLATIGR